MIPTPHNINSPVGVDRIIKNMQGKLKGNLSWLDACFGKAYRMKDTGEVDGKSLNPLYRSFEYLPEEYAGNNQYQRVTPDDNFTSMCYFLVSPATFPEYSPNKFSYIEHNVHIVFWANLDKIDSNLNENYRFTEKLIKEVEFVCTHRFNGIGGRFYLESISEDFRDIYAGFNLQEEANQPIKAPFCGFIVKGRLEYKEGCVIPQPTPNCFDAIIVNSDGTFTFNAPSGLVTEAPNTFVKVVNQSGDEVANEEVPSFIESTIIVPDCPVSGDGTAVLKDTDGNVLSTTSVAPETTVDIIAPDVDLEINSTAVDSFPSGSTIDLQLTDGTNPVNPTSVTVVGNVVTAQVAAATTGWVRNPDWLPLPEITAADDRFVGLFLVFENGYNLNSMQVAGVGTIDWGDGTVVAANNTVQSHMYDYSTIISPIHQYYDGRSYKQVIVDVYGSGISNISLERNTGVNNGGIVNYVDINYSFNASFVMTSNQRQMRMLERLNFVKLPNLTGLTGGRLQSLAALRDFTIDYTKFINTGLGGLGVVDLGNLDLYNATTAALMFEGGLMRSVGDVDASSSTDFLRMFRLCSLLEGTGVINAASCTNITTMFQSDTNLRKTTLINCGNINTTTNAFNLCLNLEELELFGMTQGFSVASCRMTAQALNDLFTSLGTASGSQTIIVTGNPGAATCDTTIATAKGFTVTI